MCVDMSIVLDLVCFADTIIAARYIHSIIGALSHTQKQTLVLR